MRTNMGMVIKTETQSQKKVLTYIIPKVVVGGYDVLDIKVNSKGIAGIPKDKANGIAPIAKKMVVDDLLGEGAARGTTGILKEWGAFEVKPEEILGLQRQWGKLCYPHGP
jgi:hypothetical protein